MQDHPRNQEIRPERLLKMGMRNADDPVESAQGEGLCSTSPPRAEEKEGRISRSDSVPTRVGTNEISLPSSASHGGLTASMVWRARSPSNVPDGEGSTNQRRDGALSPRNNRCLSPPIQIQTTDSPDLADRRPANSYSPGQYRKKLPAIPNSPPT